MTTLNTILTLQSKIEELTQRGYTKSDMVVMVLTARLQNLKEVEY